MRERYVLLGRKKEKEREGERDYQEVSFLLSQTERKRRLIILVCVRLVREGAAKL